jgi:hypothetical protein
LGWRLYRPIGLEWFEEGFWNLAQPYGNNPGTVGQYLSADYVPDPDEDGTPALNVVTGERDEDGVRLIRNDYWPDYAHRALTLDQFKALDFDVVIASVPYQIGAFRRLVDTHKPNAKLVHQMGNNWANQVDFRQCKNVMASTAQFAVPADVNSVFYHQEFDLDVFRYVPPVHSDVNVHSFLNCFKETHDYPLFYQLKDMLPEYTFKSFGAQCDDGVLAPHTKLWEQERRSAFIWHVKAGGDGFGHILFNSAAVGRPTIVKKSYYRGQLGEKLLTHGETCIDLDVLPLDQCVDMLRSIRSDEGFHQQMCQNAYDRFKATVDFDAEETELRAFLENLR